MGHDGRGLAAEFEGHRGEVLGRRTHHVFADAGGTGEQQMIERQARERYADIGFAQHNADQVLGEDPCE
ncbi:hypothetical protein D3C85_1457440 [compost metagenome]